LPWLLELDLGIRLAAAKRFAKLGMKVAMADIDDDD
jgi:hypothetical protein